MRIDGKVCKIKNIVSDENYVFLVYQIFHGADNAFTTPLESRLLGILKVSNLGNSLHTAKLSEIKSKCVIMHFRKTNTLLYLLLMQNGERFIDVVSL